MDISLFPHNFEAYRAADEMLKKWGKAAVIHPTGTGKSFIAFQFCAKNPDCAICWLSPSEYIYRTQLDNLEELGIEAPDNTTFLTYARLTLMSAEEIAQLRPGMIILDEFHRCGAEMWGQGVQRLLKAYPGAKLLGLSATNIRYLDNHLSLFLHI